MAAESEALTTVPGAPQFLGAQRLPGQGNLRGVCGHKWVRAETSSFLCGATRKAWHGGVPELAGGAGSHAWSSAPLCRVATGALEVRGAYKRYTMALTAHSHSGP